MERFSVQRYEGKIEAFDPCLIDGTNQQEIVQSVNPDNNTHDVNGIENIQHNEVPSVSHHSNETQQNNQTMHLNSTNQDMTVTPVRLPAILHCEFFKVIRLEDTNVTARCSQCQKLLNGSLKSTGNFLSHIKVF